MRKGKYTDLELKYIRTEFPEEYEEYTEQVTKTCHRKGVLTIAIPIITLLVLLIAGALLGNPAIKVISIIILQLIGWGILIGLTCILAIIVIAVNFNFWGDIFIDD